MIEEKCRKSAKSVQGRKRSFQQGAGEVGRDPEPKKGAAFEQRLEGGMKRGPRTRGVITREAVSKDTEDGK